MNTAPRVEHVSRLVVQSCAAAAGGAALVVAVGWLFGQWSFAMFRANYVPMAPGTAWLLVLLNAALFLHSRWPQRRASRMFSGVVIGFTGMLSLAVAAREWFPVQLEFEAWLARRTVGAIPVGRMSVHTAVTFLCAAGALGCLLGTASRPRWWRGPATGLAAMVCGSGSVVLLSYAAGTPLLYGSGYVPMALLSAIIFTVLGATLMLAAHPDNGLFQVLTGVASDSADAASRRFKWALVAAFLVLIAGIGATGFCFLRRQLTDARGKAEETLSAIADLKVAQIADWRRERIADANLVRLTPYAARRALDVLAQPASPTTRQMFTGWLAPLLAIGPYERGLLLDAQLNVRLVHPERTSGVLSEAARSAAEQAFRTRQIVVFDLHREAGESHVHLSVMVPLVVRRERTEDNVPAAGLAPSPADRSAGVLVLQINAHKSLYPFVKTWPTPSPTAETLLVRCEDDKALYLNELRHRTNAELRFRTPLSRREDPVVRAVGGEERIVEGRDYRDIPVLAATRAIRGSPWFLVAKVDQEEIDAPIRAGLWTTSIITLGLVLGVVLGLSLLWRQRDAEFLRRQVSVERERVRLAERIVYLTRHANDIILLWDDNLRIIDANNRALESYGYTAEEFQQLTLRDLLVPGAEPELGGMLRPAGNSRGAVFETLHQRKDGSTFPVEASIRISEVEGKRINQGIIRDITDRRQADEQRQKSEAEMRRMLAASDQSRQVLLNLAEDQRATERALRDSENRLATLISNLPGFVYRRANDGDWTMLFMSDGCRNITGYAPEDFLQDKRVVYRDVIHPEFREPLWQKWQTLLAQRMPFEEEYPILTAAGETRWVWERGRGIFSAIGELLFLEGFITDVTERKRAEEAILSSLHEKETLLKEIHHRVKNNLQVISSLLSLQAGREQNAEVLDAFRTMQARVRSMALLHETLYRSENLARVNVAAYVNSLCASLRRSIGSDAERIRLEGRAAGIELNLDQAVPCGLIINELVSNAMKHAFPDERAGLIAVELRPETDRRITLTVADDGVGLPAGLEAGQTQTLGLKLVAGLATQLDGVLTVTRSPGTTWHLVFPSKPV